MHFRRYRLIDLVNRAPFGSQGDFLNISYSSSCPGVCGLLRPGRGYGEPIMHSIKCEAASVLLNIMSFHLQSGTGRESRRENNTAPERTSPQPHGSSLCVATETEVAPCNFYRCAYARGQVHACVCSDCECLARQGRGSVLPGPEGVVVCVPWLPDAEPLRTELRHGHRSSGWGETEGAHHARLLSG